MPGKVRLRWSCSWSNLIMQSANCSHEKRLISWSANASSYVQCGLTGECAADGADGADTEKVADATDTENVAVAAVAAVAADVAGDPEDAEIVAGFEIVDGAGGVDNLLDVLCALNVIDAAGDVSGVEGSLEVSEVVAFDAAAAAAVDASKVFHQSVAPVGRCAGGRTCCCSKLHTPRGKNVAVCCGCCATKLRAVAGEE